MWFSDTKLHTSPPEMVRYVCCCCVFPDKQRTFSCCFVFTVPRVALPPYLSSSVVVSLGLVSAAHRAVMSQQQRRLRGGFAWSSITYILNSAPFTSFDGLLLVFEIHLLRVGENPPKLLHKNYIGLLGIYQ